MKVVKGSPTTRSAWLRFRRRHWVTSLVGGVSVAIFAVASVFMGDIPVREPAVPEDNEGVPPRVRPANSWPARLVLQMSTGWPTDRQVDFAGRFAARWRGPGAVAGGLAWISDRGLIWAPRWKASGARRFELTFDRTDRVEVTRLSARVLGLVLRMSDGADIWLWVRSREPDRLVEAIQALSSG